MKSTSTLLLLLLVTLGGCANEVIMTEKPLYTCPEPFTPCKPGSFTEVTFDTGAVATGYYLSIEQVDGLDTDADEFGVSFAAGRASRSDGMATIRRTSGGERTEEIRRFRFRTTVNAEPQKVVETRAFVRSIGTPAFTYSSDTILLAGRFPGTVEGDYDIASAKLKTGERLAEVARTPASRLISWESQPAFSPDGRTLYFVSSRLDGIGGTDIYTMNLNDAGVWSAPVNLGPGVNTPCDELTPFVSSDGNWLYFSSAGHSTVGGYDIFRSRLRAGSAAAAENLGRPLNTPDDELSPSSPPGADPDTLLYYSSNQPGSDRFDVWVLNRRFRGDRTTARTERPDSVRLTGTVVTQQGDPVDGATVTLDEGDPPKRVDSTRSGRDGSYGFDIVEGKKYDVTASKEGKLYGSETVEVPVYNNRDEIKRDVVFLDTVVFRVNFPFNDASNPYEYTLDDRGLPSDRRWSDVIAQAADVLRRISPNSGTVIDLVGHTDPIGSDAYNLDLGRRRAEFIRRELIRRGVSESILRVRSAGEGSPLPSYEGENDELYRSRLRRVELFRKETR